MIYNSIAEIYEATDKARTRLFESVEGLADAQATFRPAPEGWSIADIIEHLSLVDAQVLRLLQVVLHKAEAARNGEGEGGNSGTGATFAAVSIKEFVEQAATQKYSSPEAAVPTGTVPLSDSIARLNQVRDALHELRPRLEQLDCTQLLYSHPAFGPMNLYQWLAFTGVHQSRHRRQIEALKEMLNAEQKSV
jgi:uncharacterized damage-inducible protein DinB